MTYFILKNLQINLHFNEKSQFKKLYIVVVIVRSSPSKGLQRTHLCVHPIISTATICKRGLLSTDLRPTATDDVVWRKTVSERAWYRWSLISFTRTNFSEQRQRIDVDNLYPRRSRACCEVWCINKDKASDSSMNTECVIRSAKRRSSPRFYTLFNTAE